MPDTIEFIEPKEHSLDVYNDYENPHTTPAETVNKWMTLSYRLFGTMLENSEYSFFLSTPQLISQLSFLMTVCQEKTTGLRREFGWIPNSSILAHQIQHKNLLENTINFMKRWRGEMQAASLPGKIRSARRALCYPTNAVLFHLSTLQALKTHHIEMKIFEGAKENRAWLSKQLEGRFEKSVVINAWDEEEWDLLDIDHKGKKTTQKSAKGDEEREAEKKSPILMWVGYANVAILPEIFDAQWMYFYSGRDYLRVTTPQTHKFPVKMGQMSWHSVLLPTANSRLLIVFIYNFSRSLCSFEDLRTHIRIHQEAAPCVIRPYGSALRPSEKQNIYFPVWTEEDFHPNRFAEHLRETADVEEIFTKGGFGDLADENAIPHCGGPDIEKIAHVQHFSTLNFHNAPSTRFNEDTAPGHSFRTQLDPKSADTEMIPFPFCVMLWDSERHIPVYMGKITGKAAPRGNQHRKSWNEWLFGWMKSL